MKMLKKVLFAILAMSIFMTMTGTSTVFADSSIRKGTVRIVLGNTEISNCSDEVVYNGHRYLKAYWPLLIRGADVKDTYYYNDVNATNTYHFSGYGYASFFGGTNKVRINGEDFYTKNMLVYYDNVVYMSIEDITDFLNLNYGFDASKNTIYMY